jgi:hypothetical protein
MALRAPVCVPPSQFLSDTGRRNAAGPLVDADRSVLADKQ